MSTPTELSPERRADLAAFYAAHHGALSTWVRRRIRTLGEEIVADACGYAWLQLVRRPDVRLRRQGLAWLMLGAVQEAWRLAHGRPEVLVGAILSAPEDGDELPEPAGPALDPLEGAVAAHVPPARGPPV